MSPDDHLLTNRKKSLIQIRYDNYNGFKFDLMIQFQSGIRVNMVL